MWFQNMVFVRQHRFRQCRIYISLMSLYGPTFHATPIELCIKFQCNIYIYIYIYIYISRCSDIPWTVIYLVSCLVEINLNVMSVFLDFNKALETVDHKIILSKICFHGIRWVSHEWLISYLSERNKITVNDGITNK